MSLLTINVNKVTVQEYSVSTEELLSQRIKKKTRVLLKTSKFYFKKPKYFTFKERITFMCLTNCSQQKIL